MLGRRYLIVWCLHDYHDYAVFYSILLAIVRNIVIIPQA